MFRGVSPAAAGLGLFLFLFGCGVDSEHNPASVRAYQHSGLTWYAAGDNHMHAHGCSGGEGDDPASLLAKMKDTNTSIGSALIWGDGIDLDWQHFRGQQDDPISEPDYILHWDFEVSDLPGAWHGHMQLVNLPLSAHPVDGGVPTYPGQDYLLPNYDWTQSGGGIVGYAHGGVWPVGSFNVAASGVVPRELPLDIALRKVDFLSTEFEAPSFDSIDGFVWLWYQMLNAGFHIAPAAGSDYPCIRQSIGIHTMFPLDETESLSYAGYVDAVRRGQTVVRNSLRAPDDFLDVRVNGATLGSELFIQTGETTTVEVEVDAGSTLAGNEVVLIVNGEPWATQLISSETKTYVWQVPLRRSSWIAARTRYAHTAATFVLLNDCPIRNDPNAAYQWRRYLQRYFNAGGEIFGNSWAEVQQQVNMGKEVWWNIAVEGWQTPSTGPPKVCQ